MPDYVVIRTWQQLFDACRKIEPGKSQTFTLKLDPTEDSFINPAQAARKLNHALSDVGTFDTSSSRPQLNVYRSRG